MLEPLLSHRTCRVPYLPAVCLPIDIPASVQDFGICTSCPQYGPLALQCTGWTSAPATITLPSGVRREVIKYTSTGCKNQTIAPPGSGVDETMQYSVDVFYPDGAQDPLRIVMHQELWETVPSVGVIHTADESTLDIAQFEAGSLSPAAFTHCTP